MDNREVEAVAKFLYAWNPLGKSAETVTDLDGYRTEAIDIISVLRIDRGSQSAEQVVMEVLNQAFDLSLTPADCAAPAKSIVAAIGNKR